MIGGCRGGRRSPGAELERAGLSVIFVLFDFLWFAPARFVEGGSAAGLSSAAREKGSNLANRLARKVTGIELTDPMSGYFMLPAATARALVKPRPFRRC